MTTNEASRAEFEKWAVKNGYEIKRGSQGDYYLYGHTTECWKCWQAAISSRPETIDPIHGDKREVIMNALCASKEWTRGYAEAFVDEFVGGKAAPSAYAWTILRNGKRVTIYNRELAEKLREIWPDTEVMELCVIPPDGWFCTREYKHKGPCALWPNANKSGEKP